LSASAGLIETDVGAGLYDDDRIIDVSIPWLRQVCIV
jgi:hypothetical protein